SHVGSQRERLTSKRFHLLPRLLQAFLTACQQAEFGSTARKGTCCGSPHTSARAGDHDDLSTMHARKPPAAAARPYVLSGEARTVGTATRETRGQRGSRKPSYGRRLGLRPENSDSIGKQRPCNLYQQFLNEILS